MTRSQTVEIGYGHVGTVENTNYEKKHAGPTGVQRTERRSAVVPTRTRRSGAHQQRRVTPGSQPERRPVRPLPPRRRRRSEARRVGTEGVTTVGSWWQPAH